MFITLLTIAPQKISSKFDLYVRIFVTFIF